MDIVSTLQAIEAEQRALETRREDVLRELREGRATTGDRFLDFEILSIRIRRSNENIANALRSIEKKLQGKSGQAVLVIETKYESFGPNDACSSVAERYILGKLSAETLALNPPNFQIPVESSAEIDGSYLWDARKTRFRGTETPVPSEDCANRFLIALYAGTNSAAHVRISIGNAEVESCIPKIGPLRSRLANAASHFSFDGPLTGFLLAESKKR
ncbi:MAG: hypothetical protein AAB879_03060 [Patescibacteria group bacterium]